MEWKIKILNILFSHEFSPSLPSLKICFLGPILAAPQGRGSLTKVMVAKLLHAPQMHLNGYIVACREFTVLTGAGKHWRKERV